MNKHFKKSHGEFIRFGNLTTQLHNIPLERTFHTPPVEKGFYAFPRGFVEMFLVGGTGSGSLQNGRYKKFRDKNGVPIKVHYDDWDNFIDNFPIKKLKNRLHYACPNIDEIDKLTGLDNSYEEYEDFCRTHGPYDVWIENRVTKFKYGGLIWHHLFNSDDPSKDKEYSNYIKIVDSWVLTDMKTYIRCLNSSVGKDKFKCAFDRTFYNTSTKHKFGPHFDYGRTPYPYSKDHFEVYIENIQNDNKRKQ